MISRPVSRHIPDFENFVLKHEQVAKLARKALVFLGFTMQIRSKSEWGSTSTVLMFMLYWREQMIGNCTYLLRNTRPTHTVNISFTPMTMSRFRVDPH